VRTGTEGLSAGVVRALSVRAQYRAAARPATDVHHDAPICRVGEIRLLPEGLRHGSRSTLITSQLPVKDWHGAIGDAALADAILDRLVHNSHRVVLKGKSMRSLDPTAEGVTKAS